MHPSRPSGRKAQRRASKPMQDQWDQQGRTDPDDLRNRRELLQQQQHEQQSNEQHEQPSQDFRQLEQTRDEQPELHYEQRGHLRHEAPQLDKHWRQQPLQQQALRKQQQQYDDPLEADQRSHHQCAYQQPQRCSHGPNWLQHSQQIEGRRQIDWQEQSLNPWLQLSLGQAMFQNTFGTAFACIASVPVMIAVEATKPLQETRPEMSGVPQQLGVRRLQNCQLHDTCGQLQQPRRERQPHKQHSHGQHVLEQQLQEPGHVVVALPVQQVVPSLEQAVVLHQAVLLQGLPNSLCNGQMIDVVIEQAGFSGDVTHYKTQPGEQLGEAVLTLTSTFMADMCVRHFHGCVWDARGTPVTACFASPSEEYLAQMGTMPAHVESFVGELGAAVEEQTERVLEALLAPSEFGPAISTGKKAKHHVFESDVAPNISTEAEAAESAAVAKPPRQKHDTFESSVATDASTEAASEVEDDRTSEEATD